MTYQWVVGHNSSRGLGGTKGGDYRRRRWNVQHQKRGDYHKRKQSNAMEWK